MPVDLQIGFGLLGDAARVAVIGLAGHGLENVADDRQASRRRRRGRVTAVDGSGISVMSDSLIAFQPAIDEPSNIMPSRKDIVVDQGDVEGDVLPLAARVGEAEVDILDVFVLDFLQYCPWRSSLSLPLVDGGDVEVENVFGGEGGVRSRPCRFRRCGCG